MSEFAFELELCAYLEAHREGVLARQLGGSVADPGGRILDIVCVEPGPEFDERVAITGETIPDAAITADVGPGRARYWKGVFPEDCHPEQARNAMERACEIGFFESERRNGREYVRQVARYPDWHGEMLGIENKPDLGRPGDLEAQLRTDVSLALVDRCVLATETYVTRAHLNRIPEEVGVWRIHRESESESVAEIEVVREPATLPVDQPGIEPLEYTPGRTEIAVVDADAKARARRRLAERAYGKGWRTYAFPDCRACQPTDAAETGATLPSCEWADRLVDAGSECGSSCPGFDPLPEATDATDATNEIDLNAERERQTSWRANPDGKRRRQSGLGQFE